jgi:hypothetical protein
MKEKLEELKKRAQNLRFDDIKELDDIIRKTKMYLEKIFPMKFTYSAEVDSISFHPSFYVSGMGDGPYQKSWANGKLELINLLDTRIEELEIELAKQTSSQPEVKVIEKVVKVQDNARVNELIQENNALRKGKSLWNRINWTFLITVSLTVISGTFYLGHLLGNAHFDKEKLELFEKNKDLETRIDSLKKEIGIINNKINESTLKK